MKRVLPTAGLETVAKAIELEALSEEFDFAMAEALGSKANGARCGDLRGRVS